MGGSCPFFSLFLFLFCFSVEVAIHYTLLPLYVNVLMNEFIQDILPVVFHALVDTVITIITTSHPQKNNNNNNNEKQNKTKVAENVQDQNIYARFVRRRRPNATIDKDLYRA